MQQHITFSEPTLVLCVESKQMSDQQVSSSSAVAVVVVVYCPMFLVRMAEQGPSSLSNLPRPTQL